MPQPPRVKYVRDGINVVGICVYLLFEAIKEGKTTFYLPIEYRALHCIKWRALNTALPLSIVNLVFQRNKNG